MKSGKLQKRLNRDYTRKSKITHVLGLKSAKVASPGLKISGITNSCKSSFCYEQFFADQRWDAMSLRS